jgi:hypothetical protein
VIGGTGLFADGTAAAPSISFAADTDTGIYRYAANSIGFATGGANRFFMSGSQFGGVTGQNIDMPAAGSIALVASGTAQNITLTPSGAGAVVVGNTSANTARFYIQTTNTATANGKLAFQGSAGTDLLTFGTGQNIFGSQAFEWLVGSTTVAAILPSGRFLLGTTTDSGALLQVGTNTTNAAGGMVFGTDTNFYRSAAGTLTIQGTTNTILQFAEGASASVRIQQSSGACYIDTQSAQPIILRTNNTTALTLDSSQRTILSGALRLNNAYVAGAVVGTGYVTIQDSTGTTYRVPVLV